MSDYTRSFAFEANENPFVDADYTDINYTIELDSGNLLPATQNAKYARIVYTGEDVDRTADSITVELTLGIGPSVYNDIGGAALLVNGGTDDGKGYVLTQSGNNVYVRRVDASEASGTNLYGANGVISASTGDKVGLEIYDIQTSPRIRALHNGVAVSGSEAISSYVSAVVPGISTLWGNTQARGFTAIDITGLDLGGFSLSDNNDDVIDHDTAFTIGGDFSRTTITSVKIKQAGATEKAVSFSEADAALTCTAVDFHTTEIFPGAATIEVTDGTDTKTLDVTIDFTNDYLEIVATAISGKGVFKDITGAAIDDIAHMPSALAGSGISVNAAGVLAVIDPAVPTGTTATWWHGGASTHTWTVINATINQEYADGPTWDVMPSWQATSGRPDTYPAGDYVTTSGGTVDSFALTPAVSGFTINPTTGDVTFDGAVAAGQHWLTIEAADDNDTTTAPQLSVVVYADPLTLSNDRVTSITQQTATITVDAAAVVGDIFVALRTSGAYTSSDIDEIKNGTGAAWFQDRETALTLPFYVTGCDADTLYYYGIVQSDGEFDSNVLADSFTTQADITYTETGKAPAQRPY